MTATEASGCMSGQRTASTSSSCRQAHLQTDLISDSAPFTLLQFGKEVASRHEMTSTSIIMQASTARLGLQCSLFLRLQWDGNLMAVMLVGRGEQAHHLPASKHIQVAHSLKYMLGRRIH
jgi:hypothetical protein